MLLKRVCCCYCCCFPISSVAFALDLTVMLLIRYDTIRYDTRCYFNVRSKADMSQLNLLHGKQQQKSVKQKKSKM